MVTLYFHFHHNNFSTITGRDFILGIHVYLTLSHTLYTLCWRSRTRSWVQGQKWKIKVKCYGDIFIKLGMHVYLKQSHILSVDMSRSCILTFCECQGHFELRCYCYSLLYFTAIKISHFYHHKFSTTTDSHNNFATTTDKDFIGYK